MTIVFIIYFALLFFNAIVVFDAYNEYFGFVKNDNKEVVEPGYSSAGTYWVNIDVFLFIDEKSENQKVRKIINKHTVALRTFWIGLLIILPILIVIDIYL
ncbi:hypothetical protein [Flavobacterium sp.]|uniref:hypothetical protein n=1 Tax=Flavobacterium sp. TaxID=239 RepID=UPI003918ADE5